MWHCLQDEFYISLYAPCNLKTYFTNSLTHYYTILLSLAAQWVQSETHTHTHRVSSETKLERFSFLHMYGAQMWRKTGQTTNCEYQWCSCCPKFVCLSFIGPGGRRHDHDDDTLSWLPLRLLLLPVYNEQAFTTCLKLWDLPDSYVNITRFSFAVLRW